MTGHQVYRMRRTWLTFFVGVGLLGTVVPIALYPSITSAKGPRQLFMIAICGGCTLFCAAVAADALRSRIEMDATHLRHRELFRTREIALRDIVGWRRITTTAPGFAFETKGGGKALMIEDMFAFDESYYQWLDSVPNLDDRSRAAEEDEIKHDASIADTPDERYALLQRAILECRWINTAGLLLSLWAMFYPLPYRPLVFGLAVSPWLALCYLSSRRGLVKLDSFPPQLRPNVAAATILPALILALRSFDINFLASARESAVPCLGIGLMLWLFMLRADPNMRVNRVSAALSLLLFATPYGFGCARMLNVLLEPPTLPPPVEVAVRAKHISGDKGTRYLLKLEEFGEVSVAKTFYIDTAVGSLVCVRLHSGALGMQWIEVDRLCR